MPPRSAPHEGIVEAAEGVTSESPAKRQRTSPVRIWKTSCVLWSGRTIGFGTASQPRFAGLVSCEEAPTSAPEGLSGRRTVICLQRQLVPGLCNLVVAFGSRDNGGKVPEDFFDKVLAMHSPPTLQHRKG